MSLNTSDLVLSISTSLILTFPDDLVINEVKMLKVVDLPAPFGPSKPKISFCPTPNVISLTAKKFEGLYDFCKRRTLMGVFLVPLEICWISLSTSGSLIGAGI